MSTSISVSSWVPAPDAQEVASLIQGDAVARDESTALSVPQQAQPVDKAGAALRAMQRPAVPDVPAVPVKQAALRGKGVLDEEAEEEEGEKHASQPDEAELMAANTVGQSAEEMALGGGGEASTAELLAQAAPTASVPAAGASSAPDSSSNPPASSDDGGMWGWGIVAGVAGLGMVLGSGGGGSSAPAATPPLVPANMTPAQAAALTPEQVAAFAEEGSLSDLSDAAEAALAIDSLDNIADLSALPNEFIESLAPATIASIAGAQAGTVTPTQAGALTVAQIDALEAAGLLASFTPEALAVIFPALQAVALDDQASVDVRTDIVLNFNHDLNAVAGKYIRIVDDSATGLHGESTTNTQVLEATDARVTIVGGRVTINAEFDLDFNSNYHIEIDDGAFLSDSTGRAFVGIANGTTLNFTTVAPAEYPSATGTASIISDATGAMQNSLVWWDIEARGTLTDLGPTVMDASTGNNAYVIVDYKTSPGVAGADDGVETNNVNLQINNFAAGDLLYVDNWGANTSVNDPTGTGAFNDSIDSFIDWVGYNGTFGGRVILAGYNTLESDAPTFKDWVADLQTEMGGVTYLPYVIA